MGWDVENLQKNRRVKSFTHSIVNDLYLTIIMQLKGKFSQCSIMLQFSLLPNQTGCIRVLIKCEIRVIICLMLVIIYLIKGGLFLVSS